MRKHLAWAFWGPTLLVGLWACSNSMQQTSALEKTPLLTEVPSIIQSTNYSCGAASLMSVLNYYGVDVTNEQDLMKALGTNPDFGTIIENMAAYASQHGIKAEVKTNLSVADLAERLHRRQPVLIEAQAWPEGGTPKTPYPNDWDDGHYLVVIGIDPDRVYFRDPSLVGSVGYMTREEFEVRWHDISKDDKHLTHTAILFDGTPQPPGSFEHIP